MPNINTQVGLAQRNGLLQEAQRRQQEAAQAARGQGTPYMAQLEALKAAQDPAAGWGTPRERTPYENAEIGLQGFGMLGVPGLSDAAGLAGDAMMFARDPESRTPLNFGLSALGALPFVPGVGAVRGVKRLPPLYHGTEKWSSVLREGLKYGENSELSIPGSSLTSDPTVSMRRSFGDNDPRNVLRVTPDVDPQNVRNVSFGEYHARSVPQDDVLNLPNAGVLTEAETFVQRPGEVPPIADVRQLQPFEQENVLAQTDRVQRAGDNTRGITRTDFEVDPQGALGTLARGVMETRGNRGAFDGYMSDAVRALAYVGRGNAPEGLVEKANTAYNMLDVAASLGTALTNLSGMSPFENLAGKLEYMTNVSPSRLAEMGLWEVSSKGVPRINQQDLVKIANNAQRAWVRQRNEIADELQRLSPMGAGFERQGRLQEIRGRRMMEGGNQAENVPEWVSP